MHLVVQMAVFCDNTASFYHCLWLGSLLLMGLLPLLLRLWVLGQVLTQLKFRAMPARQLMQLSLQETGEGRKRARVIDRWTNGCVPSRLPTPCCALTAGKQRG